MKPHRVLIADDQSDIREALRLLLKSEGCEIVTASSPSAVLQAIEKNVFDVLLMDLNYTRDTTSGVEGLDLLSRIQTLDSTLPVVVMTAWGSVDLAVEAMRRGARDFLTKPWENERLISILRTQIELGSALRRGKRLEAENRLLRQQEPLQLISDSRTMQEIVHLIQRVGPSDANVLIYGENGTGKSVIAQSLHALSSRAAKPMITVNVGGLSEGVFESELFGHVRGAYTDAKSDRVGRFELADGSTLFLDEIANVPFAQQAKLLRVLESGEFEPVGSSRTRRVDVRILSATNADLNKEVEVGHFRQDLLFRLNTIEIHVPPLRNRREDIVPLAMHFLSRHVSRYRKTINGFDTESIRALQAHSWPGNVRELDHAVERAVLMSQQQMIRASELAVQSRDSSPRLEDLSLEEVERALIQKAMERSGGNVSEAAKTLGLSRSALYRRLQRYGL